MARFLRASTAAVFILGLWVHASQDGSAQGGADLDGRVRQFLDAHKGTWQDLNVPGVDGQTMYDIIVGHRYRSALEIGTSTGHSGIWIAWALSNTGGKLITVEIDRGRHDEAVAHFKEAGLSSFIDARLGDAHRIVPALAGPFDFVFSDADKDWYVQYLQAVLPKLAPGGCFVAHNVSEQGWGYNREFLQYLRGLSQLETTLDSRGAGMSISYRK
jgi:caffeoyl-CoA O-methyltransferase